MELTDEDILQKAYLYVCGDGPSYEFTEKDLVNFVRAIITKQESK